MLYAAPVHLYLHQIKSEEEKKKKDRRKKRFLCLVVKLLGIGATNPLQRVQIIQAVITRRNGISGASCSDLSLS